MSVPGLRRRLAKGVRTEVAHRLLDANLLTYDDLLLRLDAALGHPQRGAVACARLHQRYRVVLVDEFQDTDAVQWGVVRKAFAPPGGATGTRLVLVGDPKQAVYAFRGADVHSYLDAARTAGPDRHFTLEVNWRSDADLLAAYDALFEPLHLGHSEIVYRRVRATPPHRRSGLRGAPAPAPLRARILARGAADLVRTSRGLVQKDSAQRWIAEDSGW